MNVSPQHAEAAFSADYEQARAAFVEAATKAGAQLAHHECPARGPRGEALHTDSAWLGDPGASKVVMVLSGTHGVEGFCGSGFQVHWLRSGLHQQLPADTAVLFVHAINPYGFAWLRRVNEDNVDLNRNYLDWSQPLPRNPGYAEIASALVPLRLDGPEAAEAEAVLTRYRQQVGEVAFYRALSSGQFIDPHGLFYGGSGPTWSNRTLHAVMADHLGQATDVTCIDFHTGLGPYGYGDLMSDHEPGTDAAKRVRQFWGDGVSELRRGQSLPMVQDGPTHFGVTRALPHASVTFGTLEFGTYERERGRAALRADQWLQLYGDPTGPQAAPIKQALRRQFYPDTADWKEAVLFRGHQLVRLALAGLQGAHAQRGQPIYD
ncbi:MAG: M14 family metallopeptidase [Pseudomonadota bacterium]